MVYNFKFLTLPQIFTFYKYRLMFLLLSICVWSCNPDSDNRPIPPDLPPAINILSPLNTTLSLKSNETFSISILVADNESLDRLRIIATILNEEKAPTGEQFIALDTNLSGTRSTITFEDTLGQFPNFFTLVYDCIVQDNKNAADSAKFFINIVPPDIASDSFELLSYDNISLYSQSSGRKFGYNFTTQTFFPEGGENLLDQDIEEKTENNSSQNFQAILGAPASEFLGIDSVFVISSDDQFNFEEATYTAMLNKFISTTERFTVTPSLQENDIVIVALTKAPQPQFAVMRIRSVIDSIGVDQDRIIYDYKVSSP